MISPIFSELKQLLSERILILDGGMGTMLQKYQFDEKDFRGEVFKEFHMPLKGNNDILCLSQPQKVEEVHYAYTKAGVDILETNTLCAQSITQKMYGTQDLIKNINLAAVKICRNAAERAEAEIGKKIFVAGSIGPLTCMLSAGSCTVSYEEVVCSYMEQIEALLEGGVDLLLLETIVDVMNAKAALSAIDSLFNGKGFMKIPVMASVTLSKNGKLISGETLSEFCSFVPKKYIFALGINCSFGPSLLSSSLKELSDLFAGCVMCYPNAGVPELDGSFSSFVGLTEFSSAVKSWSINQWVNIVGGCCGTTPEYMNAVKHSVQGLAPRKIVYSCDIPTL